MNSVSLLIEYRARFLLLLRHLEHTPTPRSLALPPIWSPNALGLAPETEPLSRGCIAHLVSGYLANNPVDIEGTST